MDGGGDLAGLHDGELEIVLLGRRGVDDEGGFADAEDRHLPDLAGLVGEVLHGFGIVDDEAQGDDVVRLADDLGNGGHVGLVGVALDHRAGNDRRQLAAVRVRLENDFSAHFFLCPLYFF